MHKKIWQKIKKHQKIIIARHTGPDPDALASQIALRDTIRETFPKKEVYAVGASAARFAYFGSLNKINDEVTKGALLIALDVPDRARIDGVCLTDVAEIIKIDHHPFMEEYANIEWINDQASSTSEMIAQLILQTKLKLTTAVAEKLFMGIIADSNRFLFTNNSPEVFRTTATLIEKSQLDITALYEKVYKRSIVELRFESYIGTNFHITENGLAHLYIPSEVLKEYKVDSATPGNMINNFNYVEGINIWVIFSQDKANNNIRGTIRSRGVVINDIASEFGGGGHEFASGVRLKEQSDMEKLIARLEERLKERK